MWVKGPPSRPLGPGWRRRGAHPPETGGITATSSSSFTGASVSTGSPFSQILEVDSTRQKVSPNCSSAAAMISDTLCPGRRDTRRAGRLAGRTEKSEARHG